ncbi:LysM peptidoglycan-binding domain-containing protein [Chloroflexota bacterium]
MSFLSKSIFSELLLSLVFALSGFLQLGPIKAQANESFALESANSITLNSVQSTSTGLISGELSFPSEHIPALTIFAIRTDNGKNAYYSIQTGDGQSSYSIRVDPGVYHLLAYAGDYASGYTFYVKCGLDLHCQDHSLVPVVVEAGSVISGIDIQDWYAPQGTFPSRPDGVRYTDPPAACSGYHTIKFGETLYRVGLMYNMTWTPIARANNIQNPNRIYAGQVLCIPRSVPSTSWKSNHPAVPTFEITSVVKNKQVTIKTYNFPPGTEFVVTMGKIGTQGINGKEVALTDSGGGGTFTATYKIPPKFHDMTQVAIRLQSSIGFYSYNWFYNNSTQ